MDRELVKEAHRLRVAQAKLHLGGMCKRCGTSEGLEFDHLDASTKRQAIGRMAGWGDATFWAEVAKCQLLCRPCHVAKTSESGEWAQAAQHGKRAMYMRHGCRCDDCLAWHAEYRRRGVLRSQASRKRRASM